MPTLSTPASPSPLTEDGDQLLVELREFLQNISPVNSSSSVRSLRLTRHAHTALHLLRHLPVARDAILEYFSGVLDTSLLLTLDPSQSSDVDSDLEELSASIGNFKSLLFELLVTNGPAWAPIISQWALTLLGDLSSKHSHLISKYHWTKSGGGSKVGSEPLGILEALPVWLSTEAGRVLAEIAIECISTLKQQDDDHTEKCVSSLLEASVVHGPHFDWVVAHVGGCFPDTVISRVLAVGLKDFVAYGVDQKSQITKEGAINLSNIPKINSVVGILRHLGGSYRKHITESIFSMVKQSLTEDNADEDDEDDESQEDAKVATIPFFLSLAVHSDLIADAVFKNILEFVTVDVAEQIEDLVHEWIYQYFPASGSLMNLTIQLARNCGGLSGRDILQLLLDFSCESTSKQKVYSGCRLILDHLFGDLLEIAHQTKPGEKMLPILKTCQDHFNFFVERYLLANDAYQRKSMLFLSHIISIHAGRPYAVSAVVHALNGANTDNELAVAISLIRENELWVPGLIEESLKACLRLRTGKKNVSTFLDNLAKILFLEQQWETESNDLKIVSKISRILKDFVHEFLPFLPQPRLTTKVLKIFHFIDFSMLDMSVSLMHNLSQSLVFSLFSMLRDRQYLKDEATFLPHVIQITSVLSYVASVPPGLQTVLRIMVEGAILSPFAKIFGGKISPTKGVADSSKNGKRLFDENLKFGSTPTQQLGMSTVFHAGIIGDGKRANSPESDFSADDIETNSFIFTSILFKICHNPNGSKQGDLERREQSKESCKQLALILVDLVSPNVMYNGLPWPDEEFTRVTVERDLKISNTMKESPILWKILWGLAEARPALCYCSVILRACLAVQMFYWQSTLTQTASDSPAQLETTRKILQLMAVGQFIPPPLDGVPEILSILSPFHVHCILVDIWNYVRDNVPSPAPFSCNASGVLNRDFEPYRNYKQYCERMRLILIKHIDKVPNEFRRFFVETVGGEDASD